MRYSVTIRWTNSKSFEAVVEAENEAIAEVLAEGLAADKGLGRCRAGVESITVRTAD